MADHTLPKEIEAEIGDLIEKLCAAGWRPNRSRYSAECFGDWLIELEREGTMVVLTKDKGQYLIDADIEQMKQAGLWKAFNKLDEYKAAVSAFLK